MFTVKVLLSKFFSEQYSRTKITMSSTHSVIYTAKSTHWTMFTVDSKYWAMFTMNSTRWAAFKVDSTHWDIFSANNTLPHWGMFMLNSIYYAVITVNSTHLAIFVMNSTHSAMFMVNSIYGWAIFTVNSTRVLNEQFSQWTILGEQCHVICFDLTLKLTNILYYSIYLLELGDSKKSLLNYSRTEMYDHASNFAF